MHRLPPLRSNGQAIALPLSDRAAAGLVAAILGGPPGECDRELLSDTLSADAPLALWTACRAADAAASSTPSIRELTDWLARRALVELAPIAATSAASQSTEEQGDCTALAASSLAVARGARDRALEQSLAVDAMEQVYLLGLLHAARDWLTAGGASEHSARELLPAWLARALGQFEPCDGSETTSPEACAAWAVRHVVATDAPAALPTTGQSIAGNPHLAQAILPEVLAREIRLQQLTERFQQSLEHEKLESLKELAYGASHEINNPLANISARAQTLLPAERDPDRRRMLAAIHAQAARAHEMIADLMLFARPPQPKPAVCDLAALLRGLHAELSPLAEQQQTELVLDMPGEAVSIWADRAQIAVALRAVCVNALEALVTGGEIRVALSKSAPFNEFVQVTVSDNGPGIAPEARRHLFDPFYSGREAGRGLGFGLSKCWRIVTLHGGRVEVENTPAGGARFTISLPTVPSAR